MQGQTRNAIITGTAEPWQPPAIHHGHINRSGNNRGLSGGLQIADGPESIHVAEMSVAALRGLQKEAGLIEVLIQYTDPFLLRANSMRGIREWKGPKLLAAATSITDRSTKLCAILLIWPHDAVLLTFNPLGARTSNSTCEYLYGRHNLLRYPAAIPRPMPRMELLHVGIGPHHPRRRELVEALIKRRVFRHTTTQTPKRPLSYTHNTLVLNVLEP